ncbi:MAG: hypothetical protein JWR00_4234 [Rubritepida sp.]|nr:hypothetical protein [Rubritepida sp.]
MRFALRAALLGARKRIGVWGVWGSAGSAKVPRCNFNHLQLGFRSISGGSAKGFLKVNSMTYKEGSARFRTSRGYSSSGVRRLTTSRPFPFCRLSKGS